MVYLDGYPKVMYGSTLLKRLTVALLILTKAPLCNCLNLSNLKILTDLGLSLLTPRILTTNANLGSAGTKIWPVSLAWNYETNYLSSGGSFGLSWGLVLSFVLLGSLSDLLSSGLVGGSSLFSLLLKSWCNLLISLLFFSESFWFRNYDLFSCHYHKININWLFLSIY